MRKIISLFKREYEGPRLVYDEVVPGAEWVLAGEGKTTVKFDGTACMVHDSKLYKRYDVKKGRTPPEGFEAAQDPDPMTGHWPGWVLIGDGPDDKWHREALEHSIGIGNGTYELVGPKIQRNPYNLTEHALWMHGSIVIDPQPPRDYFGLRYFFRYHQIEGIVWHHPDGRMVKIKRRDFGFSWP